jgi:hypothetical protein
MTTPHDPAPAPADDPPVKHETRDANISTIVFVGCILVAAAVVIHVGLWGLYHYWEERDDLAKTSHLPLVKEEMNQLPAQPRLEAFQPNRAWVFLGVAGDEEVSFYVDTPITVERVSREGRREPLDLFALRPGTAVALTYSETQGLPGRPRVVRIETGEGLAVGQGRPTEAGLVTVNGQLARVVPTGGPDMRKAAEEQLRHYGWVDRKKQVAHIPIDEAMKIVVDRRLLKSAPAGEEGKGRPENPESGSGPTPGEGKR